MTTKQLTFLLSFVFLTQTISIAQNFTEDFKAINKAYMFCDLSFNIKYDYYNDVNTKKPSYFYTGEVKLKNNMMYYKMNGIELSYDSIYTCIMDHENKTIMIDTVKTKSNMLSRVNYIDSLTKVYKSISYSEVDDNNAKYTIYSHLSGISHCEIIFNKKSKLLQKITIYFLDNRDGAKAGAIRNKLVISYLNIKIDANNNVSSFSARRIVTIKGRKITPNTLYSKYKIINNIN